MTHEGWFAEHIRDALVLGLDAKGILDYLTHQCMLDELRDYKQPPPRGKQ